MKRILLLSCMLYAFCGIPIAQNVFNPADPIVRYDNTKALGTAQNPNPAKAGLQKWVSTLTVGISLGSSAWDASSYKQYFINLNGTRMAFRIRFPYSYSRPEGAAKKYPVMLFLHGAGEAGCSSNGGIYNNEKQIWIGGRDFMNRVNNNQFDGFLVYPQLATATTNCSGIWGSAASANYLAVLAMIDSMVKYTRVDIDRLLVDGLSGGGYGAWRMAADYPQRVAKILPSSAAGSVANRMNFVHIPIWFATGGKDPDPSPAAAQYSLTQMQQIGADIRYTVYPELGHAVWYNHWGEADFLEAMNDVHKANPLIFFQRNAFCPGEAINAKLGITPGFYAYEWQKDGVTIATRVNGVNTIVNTASVISYTGNEISVKAFGTYRVHFKRTAASAWSAWSLKPAVIKTKAATQTPPIVISGSKSKVLPSLDGSATVTLQLPAGFTNYEWYRVSDNVKVAATQIFAAPIGVYKARYSEQYGCGTTFSPNFTVVNANGTPKPDGATNLTTVPLSPTSVRLNWSQNANETGFEIYRSVSAGGPYQYIDRVAANIVAFQDMGLIANTPYYYKVRAVNETAAAAASNESPVKTLGDNTAPSAPSNLQYRGSKQDAVFLKWNPSTDNDGIKRYDVYVNGVKLYSTTGVAITAANLDSLTSYSFVVKAVDNAGNTSPASNQVTGYTHRQGLNYKYYNGSWTLLPDYNALTPFKKGIMDTISINSGIKTQITQYGFLWEAYIYIPVTATYTFETYSDDGSKLYLDIPYSKNAVPLLNNDSVHGVRFRGGSKLLTQGYHPIAITHFQGNYGEDMQVYWSNNAGLAKEKIPKYFFSHVNGSSAAAPAMPLSLTATATAFNKIRLTWGDNSNNETGFEVVRSLTSNGTFVPLGATPANTVSFTDSGLTASKAYYYKIRSIGANSESAYTTQVSATTPVVPPTPAAPSQLSAQISGGNALSLVWNDNSANETAFRIYRSANNVTFALVGTTAANANAYTDATAVAFTPYYYYVAGINGSGEGSASNILQVTAGNNAPIVNTPASLFVKTDATVSADFTVNDSPSDQVSVVISNKPSFVTLESLGGANYRIKLSPTVDNQGWIDLNVVATDNGGKSTTKIINVSVADKNTRSVYVNFGSAGKTAPLPWNNWLGIRGANNIISNLKDETNTATPFSVTTVSGWATTTDLGHITGNNSGVIHDAALQSGIADNGTPRQLLIGGLNPAKRYNIVFIGSQNEGLPATTEYASGIQKATMNATYNTNQTANLNSLVPNATGQLTITATRVGAAAYSYLNALVIEEYDPSITLLNPENLFVEAVDRTSIKLSWADRTNNESAVNGYELTRATDSLFTQNTAVISLPANTTTYKNTGLTPNTKYWYRIRAANSGLYSGYSNRARTITPASSIYVNFNTTVPDAPAPWNNLASSPMEVFTVNNLKNQSNVATTVGLQLVKVFNGEFTAGMNTGNNSGIAPDNALMGNYWLDKLQLGQIRVTGLALNRKYRFGFFGSSGPNGWFKGNYTATYAINGRMVYLNSWQNTTKIVYIGNVTPDDNGQVMLDFSTTATADWGFNAGIIIEEYADAQGGTVANSATLNTDELAAVDENEIKLKVYPNPFRDQINLDLYNNSAGNRISAEIYDLSGRLIYRHNYNNLPAGHNTLLLNATEARIVSGVYVVAVKINGKLAQAVKMMHNKK